MLWLEVLLLEECRFPCILSVLWKPLQGFRKKVLNASLETTFTTHKQVFLSKRNQQPIKFVKEYF